LISDPEACPDSEGNFGIYRSENLIVIPDEDLTEDKVY